MHHISDMLIESVISADEAQTVLRLAFETFGTGGSAVQKRLRTGSHGTKLSTLGAVIPSLGVAGAKVYTTIEGQFSFVILLFSAEDGRPLATLDAGAITRLRTAATSVIAAERLVREGASRLALFGAGIQGTEHAVQMCRRFSLKEIAVFDPYIRPDALDLLSKRCEATVWLCKEEDYVGEADIIVTASRATQPLFDGNKVRAGSFIAAVGSSLPETRELDDRCLSRASLVVVDWQAQAMEEAGDLIQASPDCLQQEKIVDLSEVLLGRRGRLSSEDVIVYKSVGIGLQDIALAGYAYSKLFND